MFLTANAWKFPARGELYHYNHKRISWIRICPTTEYFAAIKRKKEVMERRIHSMKRSKAEI